jgi:hypothetical protein
MQLGLKRILNIVTAAARGCRGYPVIRSARVATKAQISESKLK